MNTGEILLDEENGYRQKKFLTFHEYIGKENYSGFKYGVNLKSIQRTLDSNGVVSKIIIKNNANEFAENGLAKKTELRDQILSLFRQGFTIEDIAQKLHISQTEVTLTIEMFG